jgi:hypothetical protein
MPRAMQRSCCRCAVSHRSAQGKFARQMRTAGVRVRDQ